LCDRDENTKRPLPRRLQELVAQYPYTATPDQTPHGFLTRPRFSTRRYDALFVRVEAVYADAVLIPPSRSPVGVFTDALRSVSKSDSGGHSYLWNQVKAATASDSDDKPLPAILSDDTINLLSLVSTDPKEQVLLGIPGASSALVSPLSPVTEAPLSPTANGNGVSTPVRKPTLPSSTPQSPKDWAEFSSAGFGETTISQDFNFASSLLDKDVEVTQPPVQRRPSKQKQNKNPVAPVEPVPPVSDPKPAPEEAEGPKLILVTTEVVQLDEAFIDFWRDAVVDPISSDWPVFVVGELKHPLTPRSASVSPEDGKKGTPGGPINWIIIEEKFRRSTPPPTPVIPHETLAASGGLKVPAAPLKRSSSPRPSFGEKKSTSLSATLRRFTLFGTSKDDLTTEDTSPTAGGSGKKDSFGGRKKFGVGKSPMISEMGEAGFPEEPESQPEVPKKVDEPGKVEKIEEDRKGRDQVVTVAVGAVGGSLLATAVGSDGGGPTIKGVKEDPLTKDDKLPAPHQDIPTSEEKLKIPVASNSEVPIPTPDIPAPEEPTPAAPVSVPEVVEEPDLQVAETEPDILPSVPESIVSHGETPGPQLALNSTEAGLHRVSNVEQPQEPATELTVPLPEPVIEHLEDKVEDSAADVGVDLDPVPIISNDPAVTEYASPVPPSVPPSEELEEDVASAQPVLGEVQPADNVPPTPEPEETVQTADIVTKDIPIVQSALDG
jgi:hypothetical protein